MDKYGHQTKFEGNEAAPGLNLINYVKAWDEVVEENLVFYVGVKNAERLIKN